MRTYFDRIVSATGKKYYIERSISGYYRLMLDGEPVFDDSAAEEVNEDRETTEAFFANYLLEYVVPEDKIGRYNEIFAECFKNLETFEKVAIHNNYVIEGNGYGNEICENTEDFIDAVFPSAYDAISHLDRHYSIKEEWAWVDGDGYLHSSDRECELELSDVDEMAEYYLANPSYLKYFEGMKKWYDAVEHGLDEEKKNEN